MHVVFVRWEAGVVDAWQLAECLPPIYKGSGPISSLSWKQNNTTTKGDNGPKRNKGNGGHEAERYLVETKKGVCGFVKQMRDSSGKWMWEYGNSALRASAMPLKVKYIGDEKTV